MRINPYLAFNGNCRAAFEFYAVALNGEMAMMFTNGESPMADQMPKEMHDQVMHARLIVGNIELMGSDMPAGRETQTGNVTVSINVDDVADAERVFAALSEGAEVSMPLQETFWAARFGMLTDQFGIAWMVNCEVKQA